MTHLLFIVARTEYIRHDLQLMVVELGGLGQLRSNFEFLILRESEARCMCGIKLLREQILHDKHIVGLHTRDAARAIPIHLQLGRTALAVFRDKHEVAHLEFLRKHMRLVFCPPDQFSRDSYVDDNSCLLVSSLHLYFYTMISHRDIYIYKC
jgi:hypothetical protein